MLQIYFVTIFSAAVQSIVLLGIWMPMGFFLSVTLGRYAKGGPFATQVKEDAAKALRLYVLAAVASVLFFAANAFI